jgi:hypothetical protein
MKIRFNSNQSIQVLGEENPLEVNQGDIFETTDIESHENDDDSVDIHLEDGTILMYVSVTCFDELPMA